MNKFILPFLFLFVNTSALGQNDTTASLKMRAEVAQDNNVSLRWAPTNSRAWKLLNKYGVRIERDIVYEDSKVLNEPQTAILIDCLRPDTTEYFKTIAQTYDYGAIIAQAIWGVSFDISGSNQQGGISSLIAQSEQDEQRFAMSLYAADLCFPAAEAVGWGLVDSAVVAGNKYLYRVVSLVPAEIYNIEQGVVFVEPSRATRLVKPLDFRVAFMDSTAVLSWNYRTLDFLYNSYMPERSTDGVNFRPISGIPTTKMGEKSNSGSMMYVDQIQNFEKYYYRLRGITSFGNYGSYSDTISGVSLPELKSVPVILSAVPNDTGGIDLEWDFDQSNEDLIMDFTLERSDDNKKFDDFVSKINKQQRRLSVKSVKASNYFILSANTITGNRKRSFPVFFQPSDTIPPAIPKGIKAIADTSGAVYISWEPNTDTDIYGYRLYRGQTLGEELIVLNDVAIRGTSYIDSVSTKSLNSKIYYSLTALDERYNQSAKCEIVEIIRPSLVAPTPPFIVDVTVENGKNTISWVSGAEETLAGYDLYRDSILIANISSPTTLNHEDQTVENGKSYNYVIYSKSVNGLSSKGSVEYSVIAINKGASKKTGVEFSVVADDKFAVVKWNVKNGDATTIQIYKKMDNGPYSLFENDLLASGGLEDRNVLPTKAYKYMLVIKFNNSQPLSITKSFMF